MVSFSKKQLLTLLPLLLLVFVPSFLELVTGVELARKKKESETETEQQQQQQQQKQKGVDTLVRIDFGSCNKPYLKQKLWTHILDRHPDLWMWTGDIVYHDRPNVTCTEAMRKYLSGEAKYFQCDKMGTGPGNESEFDNNFAMHWKNPHYKKLAETTPIIGIYDDHDYGRNDGDFKLRAKQQSKEALLRFLKADEKMDIRYHRNGLYYYYSVIVSLDPKNKKIYQFGENEIIAMSEKHKDQLIDVYWNNNKTEYFHIDIYLLDNRYFLKEDKEYPLLGPEQWKWLVQHLQSRAHIADINFFISGIQVFGEYRSYYAEQWYKYSEQERIKLFNILKMVNNPVFLSGDVHFAEMQKLEMECRDKSNKEDHSIYPSYFIYEITSSGMTHSWKGSFPNKLIFLSKYLATLVDPDGFSFASEHSFNFGEIEVLWNPRLPNSNKTVLLRVYNVDGQVALEEAIIILPQSPSFSPSSPSFFSIFDFFSRFNESDLACEIVYPRPLWRRRLYFLCTLFIMGVTIFTPIALVCAIPILLCSFLIRLVRSKRSSSRSKND